MEQGWVYVLVNSSIPGMYKVGRTTRLPSERAAELSAATGVATPFVIAFEQEFADCVTAEQQIHAELDRRGHRIAPNREFFSGSSTDIVRVVLDAATAIAAPTGPPAGQLPVGQQRNLATSATDLFTEGDRHLNGTIDTLQDGAEAVRFYHRAATRGSIMAMERLGGILARTGVRRRDSRRRAIRYLKDGAKRGNYYCYTELASLYAAEGNVKNFNTAWSLFFSMRATKPLPEVEAGAFRFAMALRDYIATALDLGLVPNHLSELRTAGEEILQCLLATLDEVRDIPDQRTRLASVLRWTYTHLVPPPLVTSRVRPSSIWHPDWHAIAAAGR
jgi:hypothetical protein